MRNVRTILCGVLCAGLLLCGIGTGIAFSEFSDFTYAGERLLGNPHNPLTSSDIVELIDYDYDGSQGTAHPYERIEIDSYLDGQQDLPVTLQVSDQVKPGTIRLDAQYLGIESQFCGEAHWGNVEDSTFHIYGYLYNDSDLKTLLEAKDLLLEDLKAHRLGEYRQNRLLSLTVTVNSTDADLVYYQGQRLIPQV